MAEAFDRAKGEPVELREPSPEWAVRARLWIAAIMQALPGSRVEHVGSTAVPGLVAKPVVDLLVSVSDVEDETAYRPALELLGLVLRAREPGHRFLRPPADQPRTLHVHLCEHGSSREREYLLFRDRLRARPDLAADYASLKRRLAGEVGQDRAAYLTGKAAFIRAVLHSATRAAADQRGGRPRRG